MAILLRRFYPLFTIFARFGAHYKVDNDGGNDEDDNKEEPDWTLDHHFRNLLSYAFKFDGINNIEDPEHWSFTPRRLVIHGSIWQDGTFAWVFLISI